MPCSGAGTFTGVSSACSLNEASTFQLLADIGADLALPATAGAAAAGRAGRVVVCVGEGRLMLRGLARRMGWQPSLDRGRVGRLRRGVLVELASRSWGSDFIQGGRFDQAALSIVEAHAACAERRPVTPRELQLQLGDHELEQLHLGAAWLQVLAQCNDFGGAAVRGRPC